MSAALSAGPDSHVLGLVAPQRSLTLDAHRQFRAMATTVTVRLWRPVADPRPLLAEVERIFAEVERQCTRFDASSDLMRANTAATQWASVGPYCESALREAAEAHRYTDGLFDPRVLGILTDLGYDRTLPFNQTDVRLTRSDEARSDARIQRAGVREQWAPQFDGSGRVLIGPVPVDLGGIGKGLAVRWAAEALLGRCEAFLVEAGGDCYLGGDGLDGQGWSVGVEDPDGGNDPIAVLALRDTGCATSSTRIRRWSIDGADVHHLIDPRTAAPAETALCAVTVVDGDPARAEVWSKVALILGTEGTDMLQAAGLPAMWVGADGRTGSTSALEPLIAWRAA